MGNFCRKDDHDSAQLSNKALQGSLLEPKQQQPSNSLKVDPSNYCMSSLQSPDPQSSHNRTEGKSCAKCELMITESIFLLDDYHVYHESCLRDWITGQLSTGLQKFKCCLCPLTFGAKIIKNLNIKLPADYYYCRSCQDNLLYIDPNNSINVICQKCRISTIFIPFEL